MAEEAQRNEIATRRVVFTVPKMDAVIVRPNIRVQSTDDCEQTMDLYLPPSPPGCETPKPVVILVSGFPDPGFEAAVGCKFKEMGTYTSWARLLAASGLAVVTYTNNDPVADFDTLLHHLRSNAAALGIDGDRMGVMACSGNVPMALSVLMQKTPRCFRCAALSYGYMLDLGGATGVAEAAKQWHFVNPSAERSLDLLQEIPLLVVRAGEDAMPGLNHAIDDFVAAALSRNLPLTLLNHASAEHAFDVADDSRASRQVIRQMLAFMSFHLLDR